MGNIRIWFNPEIRIRIPDLFCLGLDMVEVCAECCQQISTVEYVVDNNKRRLRFYHSLNL